MLKNVRTLVLGTLSVVGIASSGAAGYGQPCVPNPPSHNECPLGSQYHSTDRDVVIADVIDPVTTIEKTTQAG